MSLHKLAIDIVSYFQTNAAQYWLIGLAAYTLVVVVILAFSVKTLGRLIERNFRALMGLIATAVLVASCFYLWSGVYEIKSGTIRKQAQISTSNQPVEMSAQERANRESQRKKPDISKVRSLPERRASR